MPPHQQRAKVKSRQSYDDEFKREAVQMLLDGHTAPSVAERLRLSGTNVLYRRIREALGRGGAAARPLDDRLSQLKKELRR